MTIEIKLHDGEIIRTTEDPQDLADRFQTALRDGTLIEVARGDGEMVGINPAMIATIGKPASRGGSF